MMVVPDYVIEHAPLLHLHSKDPYGPSSIAAQLVNTHAEIDGKPAVISSAPLTLDNLDQLNSLGKGGGKDVYLTSNDDVTTNPKWLEGTKPSSNGSTDPNTTSIIIVVEKGSGILDAFYFYFFAFNWGGVVLSKQLGDHVGDWEHTMIRFTHGTPTSVWLSQHSNGSAYTFSALQKDPSGKRPILFLATGSHAIYPTSGPHDHTIPNLNLTIPFLLVDECDAGPIWDPVPACYKYVFDAATQTFSSTGTDPVGWLRFKGGWGDKEYAEEDARQKGKRLFGFKKYVGGPTGPGDKQLGRKEVWPENEWSKGQRIRDRIEERWWRSVVGRGMVKIMGGKRVAVSGEKM